MSLKSTVAKPLAKFISKKIKKEMNYAIQHQQHILQQLLTRAQVTVFGKDHKFDQVTSAYEYTQAVPIRDYELLKPYIERIKLGEQNVLWKGKPLYFAKTSGTTSGVKYIPITSDSISNHLNTARNALLCYMAETGNVDFVNGNMIFLSGSPVLENIAGINTGRLSGIVNHHIPGYLRKNQLPSYNTNCIDDWEIKLDKIVEETIDKNMTLISGIPPWMQMYFDKLQTKSGKKMGDLFPDFSVLVHGGVNFEPYKAKLFDSIGRSVHTIETFPASEGFFAFQDTQTEEGMLLNTNSGIYFEFVKASDIFNETPKRYTLADVALDVNYALIISSNAGLWGYNIGDTVKFVSLNPYRIIVSGRIKHFISAFGEHVIAEEVEHAMKQACEQHNVRITEFTVAPYISQQDSKSYHEWFIEFETLPNNMHDFSITLNNALRNKNVYYDDLIKGNILQPLKIKRLPKNAFIDYMKSIGKLGGQNKTPRLSNDRKLVDELGKYC
jgi:hypothetical protein